MRTKLNHKKSQGHVEIIASFIIFIGFVIAIFVFIYPLRQPKLTYSALNDVQDKVFQNLSFKYQTVSLVLNNPESSCFRVDDPFDISSNLIVQDVNSQIRNSKKQSGYLYIDFTPGNKYYRLYFSDSFDAHQLADVSGCDTGLTSEAYSFGVLDSSEAMLFENIVNLDNAYVSDYSDLRASLGLKNDFEFIIFDKATRAQILNSSLGVHKLTNTNVLSREIPLTVLDKDAVAKEIIFNLRVW